MTSATTPHTRPGRQRRGPGWVPNQHGAWAMLASPLLVGVLAGGVAWVQLPLAAFWFAGYFAFFATSLWLKARRRAKWFPPVRAYGVLTALLGIAVLAMQPSLVRWTPLFVVPLGIGLYAAAQRRDRALVSGLATTAGSALMTVVAYDAGPGSDLTRAWELALVQFLYFAGTIFYVKTVIRERDNVHFRWVSAGFHAAALVLVAILFGIVENNSLAWPLLVVFAALLARAILVPPYRPTPKQVGIAEIAATVAVAATSLLL
ncbi:MAG TPA: YwiC-like family protein [Marmoricola sp.]|nr:YwiC-like family protein [Marmoricola sp.]